jgi:hypothetical protein
MKKEDLEREARLRAIEKRIPNWKAILEEIRTEYEDLKQREYTKDLWLRIAGRSIPENVDLKSWISFISTKNNQIEKEVRLFISQIEKEEQENSVIERIRQEYQDLGGGDEYLGREYLEKYLFD